MILTLLWACARPPLPPPPAPSFPAPAATTGPCAQGAVQGQGAAAATAEAWLGEHFPAPERVLGYAVCWQPGGALVQVATAQGELTVLSHEVWLQPSCQVDPTRSGPLEPPARAPACPSDRLLGPGFHGVRPQRRALAPYVDPELALEAVAAHLNTLWEVPPIDLLVADPRPEGIWVYGLRDRREGLTGQFRFAVFPQGQVQGPYDDTLVERPLQEAQVKLPDTVWSAWITRDRALTRDPG